jgi:hypothetical protein
MSHIVGFMTIAFLACCIFLLFLVDLFSTQIYGEVLDQGEEGYRLLGTSLEFSVDNITRLDQPALSHELLSDKYLIQNESLSRISDAVPNYISSPTERISSSHNQLISITSFEVPNQPSITSFEVPNQISSIPDPDYIGDIILDPDMGTSIVTVQYTVKNERLSQMFASADNELRNRNS